MSKQNAIIDTVFQVATDAVNKGIAHLYTEDGQLFNNTIHLKGREVVNFGSCSYLGLEFDERMITASQEAVRNYGTTFAESRAYVSIRHYEELENLFGKIFSYPSLVAQTTTLGHIATIPVLVNDDDAIILDHQVHNSVHTAVSIVKSRGVKVEMVRHNRIDMLEDRIKFLRQRHSRIWYMADGIYSMYGDASPVNEVHELLNRYKELYYYVDDAHGMSCFGKNGCGSVLSQLPMHDRMILASSLAKGFATGGAVLVFPNKELAGKVRKCGSSFITSGPMQPCQLGAAIAAAKIHLTDEIYSLQDDLHENIKFANLMLKKYGLPVVAETDSPVFFVGVGLPKLGYNMVRRMLDEGYYLNLGIFPAVPIKNTGIRFTITRLHTFQQIENMIAAMAENFPKALREEEMTMEQIYHAFKMQSPEEKKMDTAIQSLFIKSELTVQHTNTIAEINKEEWNNLLGERGTFDWGGMKFLEETFSKNILPENNWDFDYVIIRDRANQPVLATLLTASLCKEDMLAPAAVSEQVEQIRQNGNPYYLCSKVLSIGTPLTEGEHLFIDKTSPLWKEAMRILLEKISELQEKYEAQSVLLRDFHSTDDEMDAFLIDNGYFKVTLPDNHYVEPLTWNNKEEFISRLTKNSRENFKRYIQRYEDKYEVEIACNPTMKEIKHWYQLYLNVKEKSLELNTFPLPFKLFENMAKHENWEAITFRLKPEFDTRTERKPIAVVFNYKTNTTYNFIIVGMDYHFLEEYKIYKQALYRLIMRARELNKQKVSLGFTTSFEKRKLGARIIPTTAYMQTKDNYNMAVLETMNRTAAVKI